jgi:hypothetical protein
LEICALTGTLILDEDGLYDPQQFNDRLLLGLKGTMSEAELHLLRARLRGGLLNKARRGELRLPMPVGLVHDEHGRVVLDPDRQVRQALTNLFETFRTTGSALGTVKRFNREGWLFPRRARGGPNRGELLWGPLVHTQTLNVLHNPRYAGAYVFGRRRVYRTGHGTMACQMLPQDQWTVLLLAGVYKLSSPSDAPALPPRATNLSNPWFSRHFWSTPLNTPRAEALSICMTYLSKWQYAPKTPRLPHYPLFFSAICFLTRLLAILDGLAYDLS